MNRRALGAEAEKLAEQYLRAQGYLFMARNWRCRSGEIDLIFRDERVIVFVEVRSRSNTSRYGTAIESIDARKQRQVRGTAEVFLYQQRLSANAVRFDVITVHFQGDNDPELKHWHEAF
ncbi:YraN family protein [Paenibacillus terrigena]|uniref:YraN family protein n=1 Tax=Paenibacillus terrigena TaxID=369333 RepID=UPI0028D86635|nr:YraN family protein [Paenibacillus terrigena]